MGRLLLLFVVVPAVELALLIELGSRIGTLATLGIIAGTGVIGAALARRQGLGVLRRLQQETNQGRLPADPLVDGAFLLVAGALLVTPGVLTDVVGFLCLVPGFRAIVKREVLRRFKAAGVESISLSLDGSTAESHDAFRGVRGCFARTREAAGFARDEGLALQINTLVTAETKDGIPEIHRLVREIGPMRWSLFFLIAVGRGGTLREVSPEQCEVLHHRLDEISKEAPFIVATTEAPHFRRVASRQLNGNEHDHAIFG